MFYVVKFLEAFEEAIAKKQQQNPNGSKVIYGLAVSSPGKRVLQLHHSQCLNTRRFSTGSVWNARTLLQCMLMSQCGHCGAPLYSHGHQKNSLLKNTSVLWALAVSHCFIYP